MALLKIYKLFDVYNYEIDLSKPCIIIIGENGSGKSTVLKIINALINFNFCELCKYRFEKIEIVSTIGVFTINYIDLFPQSREHFILGMKYDFNDLYVDFYAECQKELGQKNWSNLLSYAYERDTMMSAESIVDSIIRRTLDSVRLGYKEKITGKMLQSLEDIIDTLAIFLEEDSFMLNNKEENNISYNGRIYNFKAKTINYFKGSKFDVNYKDDEFEIELDIGDKIENMETSNEPIVIGLYEFMTDSFETHDSFFIDLTKNFYLSSEIDKSIHVDYVIHSFEEAFLEQYLDMYDFTNKNGEARFGHFDENGNYYHDDNDSDYGHNLNEIELKSKEHGKEERNIENSQEAYNNSILLNRAFTEIISNISNSEREYSDFDIKGILKQIEYSKEEDFLDLDIETYFPEALTSNDVIVSINLYFSRYFCTHYDFVDINLKLIETYNKLEQDANIKNDYISSNSRYFTILSDFFTYCYDDLKKWILPFIIEGSNFDFNFENLNKIKMNAESAFASAGIPNINFNMDKVYNNYHVALYEFYSKSLNFIKNLKYTEITKFEKTLSEFLFNKKIEVTPAGLKIYNENKVEVSLSCLSSGEKKIIVILFNACFNTNSALLIDEPEISMTIFWQKKLLPKILELNSNKKIIIVTHSPFIVDDDNMLQYLNPLDPFNSRSIEDLNHE